MLDSAHMWRRFRLPVGAIATLLLVLIGVLAVLQYRWLGQISDAERTERRATLAAGAREFALDFDRELARAYLLFQGEPPLAAGDQEAREQDLSARFAARYDHWQANSRFPKLLKEVYAFTQAPDGTPTLRRFDLASRQLVAAEWPAAMADWRKHLDSPAPETTPGRETLVVRRIPPAIWESVPALVVPSPIIHFTTGVSSWTTAIDVTHEARRSGRGALALAARPAERHRLLGARARRGLHRGGDAAGAGAAPLSAGGGRGGGFAGLPHRGCRPRQAGAALPVDVQLRAGVRRHDRCRRRSLPGPDAGLHAARRRSPALHDVHGDGDPAGRQQHLDRTLRRQRRASVVDRDSAERDRTARRARRDLDVRDPDDDRPGAAAVARAGVAPIRIARSGRRRRPPPQPGRQLQHPRRARRQHGPARADDEAGAAAGAAADGVRGDGVARAADAAGGDSIGRRQPRRRRHRR